MELYKINDKKIKPVKKEVKLERYIQDLFEKNLQEINGSIFLETEFNINVDIDGENKNYRLDTLALGNNYEPIIIEYKKDKSHSILNQAATYMEWLLNNKADFKEVLRKKANKLDPDNIDKIQINNLNNNDYFDLNDISWDEAKIILVAQSFDKQTKSLARFLNLNIDLYEFTIFNENLILDRKLISKNNKLATFKSNSDSKSRPVDGIDYRLEKAKIKNTPLYELNEYFEEQIMERLDNVEIVNTKFYRAVKDIRNIFTYFIPAVSRNEILVYSSYDRLINKDDFKLESKGHWGSGSHVFSVKSTDDVDRLIDWLL